MPVSTSSVGMVKMMEHFAKRKDTKESQESVTSDDIESEKSKLSEDYKTESFNSGPVLPPNMTTFEPSGVKPRKPCNCTKSQCLKL